MIDILVSRFLYIFCWKNKVAIILIILSASLGMLMMLSFHVGKQVGGMDEVLQNGKGRVPIMRRSSRKGMNSDISLISITDFDNKGKLLVDIPSKRVGNKINKGDKASNNAIQTNIREQFFPKKILHESAAELQTLEENEKNKSEKGKVLSEVDVEDKSSNLIDIQSGKDLKKNRVINMHRNNEWTKKAPIQSKGIDGLKYQGTPSYQAMDEKKEGKGGILHGHKERKKSHNIIKEDNKNMSVGNFAGTQNHIQGKVHKKHGTSTTPNNASPFFPSILSSKKVDNLKQTAPPVSGSVPSKIVQSSRISDTGKGGKSDKRVNKNEKPSLTNNTDLIAALTEQQKKLPFYRHRRKIDTLLNVLKKYAKPPNENQDDSVKNSKRRVSTQESFTKAQHELKYNEQHSKSDSNKIINMSEHALQSNDNGNSLKPIWHMDHYHRDSNTVVIQEPAQNDGKARLVLKQTGEEMKNSPFIKATNSHIREHQHVNININENDKKENSLAKESMPRPRQPLNVTSNHFQEPYLLPNISNLFMMAHKHTLKNFKPYHSASSFRKAGYWPDRLAEWLDSEDNYCDGNFKAYGNEFAIMKNVIIDRNFCHGRKGGEDMAEVINQPEEEEYFTYFPGFYQLQCSIQPQYYFNNNNHLNQWLYSMSNTHDSQLYNEIAKGFTIAVVRYEYANLYHTMTDWYNAFLVMEFSNKTQSETNILIIDGHPLGALDSVWSVLFNSSRRISDQSMRTKYSQLAWNMLGYNSAIMDHYIPNIPMVEEFRTFFLSSFRITEERKLDCDKINILFIWRRDYVAHPRNPTGSVSRKIQNEQELVITLRQNFPLFTVKGVQIDLFEMDQQLKFVTQTDILIAMHGAGLTHAFFLPKHAGIIELIPTYWSAANQHFHAIAKWRHLHYREWTNTNPENEAPNHYTKIPPEVLNSMVLDLVQVLCGLATDPPDDSL